MKTTITALGVSLALASPALAHHPKPPTPPTTPPVVVTPAPTPNGGAARAGYCIDGVFFDLLLGQPQADPTDPRWAGKTVLPAMVGLPGNPNAIHCG